MKCIVCGKPLSNKKPPGSGETYNLDRVIVQEIETDVRTGSFKPTKLGKKKVYCRRCYDKRKDK